jgi:hypothetical protein
MSMNLNDGISQVVATGGELSIPWDFKISDRSELRVVRTRGTSDEVLVLNSTYTIADNQLNQDLGGVAVLTGSATPALAGDIYTMLLDTPYARGTSFGSSDFNQAGDLFANVLNNQFDNIVRMCQRLGRDVGKSLKFDETLDIPVATITAAPVDGQLLAFQGSGGNVVGVTLGGIPNLSTVFTGLTAGDSLDYNGANWVNRRHLASLGTNIASAGTTALGAADSDFVTVTGTTTITSFGTPATFSRKHVWVVFAGALTLTHNATSLILPTGANITTAAGDIAECVHISGANWRVVNYERASGQSLVSPPTLVLGTPIATTSGTAIDITGLPAGIKQIIISFDTVTPSGGGNYLIQLGDSGGIETTGYVANTTALTSAVVGTIFNTTDGIVRIDNNGLYVSGNIVLSLIDAATFTWAASCVFQGGTTRLSISSGTKSLSATLDRIRLTTVGGASTFTAGKLNIQYQ